jgi:hypothetical protein
MGSLFRYIQIIANKRNSENIDFICHPFRVGRRTESAIYLSSVMAPFININIPNTVEHYMTLCIKLL